MASRAVAVRGSASSLLHPVLSAQATARSLPSACVKLPTPSCWDEYRKFSSSFAGSSSRCRVSQREKGGRPRGARCAAAPVGLGPEDDDEDSLGQSASSEAFRNRLNAMLEEDSQSFRGTDLADLIREKYGRSYDAVFIQKDFLGRKLLALNIMWKYQEQRSFPLTEDEYIYRLDGIAETLREWGAVSLVKNSLKSTRERPRIGKAVSLMIDPELLGARGNEWLAS